MTSIKELHDKIEQKAKELEELKVQEAREGLKIEARLKNWNEAFKDIYGREMTHNEFMDFNAFYEKNEDFVDDLEIIKEFTLYELLQFKLKEFFGSKNADNKMQVLQQEEI